MRILFIDDDPMNLKVVREMLTTTNAEFVGAQSGAEGLALIEEQDFSIILLDLRMPVMDGFEVLKTIRARDDAKANTIVIIVTADTAMDLRGICLDAGADEILIKPVEMRGLFETIAFVVSKRKREAKAAAKREAAA